MKLLMICYYYTPISDIGSRRSVAFAKYFKKYGWNPFVLSVKNPDRVFCSVGKDSPPEGIPTEYSYSIINLFSLLGKMNGVLARVLKLFKIEITKNYFINFFCFPDHFIGWIPLTILRSLRIILKNKIDVIYVSCLPFSAAITGLFLKKLMKKPLLLDFRDPFVVGISAYYYNLPKYRIVINRWFERLFLRNADLFFVTSEDARQEYIKEYPWIESRIFTIYNGIDLIFSLEKSIKKFDKFSIIYAGQFYNYVLRQKIYTEMFFKAIAYLKSMGDISSRDFQFLFFGDEYRDIVNIAELYGIDDLVIASSQVPYSKILDTISRSHLVLYRTQKLTIGTKFYDAIPLNVPFLATIPHGDAEELIKKYSPGSYIISEDGTYINVANSIKDARRRYREGKIPDNQIKEFNSRLTRENITLKLMNIIEENLKQIKI